MLPNGLLGTNCCIFSAQPKVNLQKVHLQSVTKQVGFRTNY